jgi:hypothetical protein
MVVCILPVVMFAGAAILFGGEDVSPPATAPGATAPAIRHRFLAVDESRKALHFVDEYDRKQDWSVAGNFRDIQLIGGFRVALSDGLGVTVVDLKTKRIAASIHPEGARGTQSFRWLPDGRFQIVAGGVLTADAAGQVLTKAALSLGGRICRTTADGGWVFGSGAKIMELARDGKVRAQHTVPDLVRPSIYHVAKREDGGYFATCGYAGCAVSLDAKGTVLQRFEYPHRFFFGGLQVLANGNLVVANWAGHGGGDVRDAKKGPQAIEFTPDGKPVWTFRDPEKLGSIHHVIVLDGLDVALPHEEVGGKMIPVKNAGVPAAKVETK